MLSLEYSVVVKVFLLPASLAVQALHLLAASIAFISMYMYIFLYTAFLTALSTVFIGRSESKSGTKAGGGKARTNVGGGEMISADPRTKSPMVTMS